MNVMHTIDALMKRKLALNQMTDISDIAEYAERWNELAAEFDALSMCSNAEQCRCRWMYYRDLAPGAYIRKIEMPFAETLPKRRSMSAAEAHVIVWMVE